MYIQCINMNKHQQTNREKSGKLLQANVKRLNPVNYQVKSTTTKTVYKITLNPIGWICSCPDHTYRGVKCKHIYAVEFSLELRKEVEVRKIEQVTVSGCKFCKAETVVKCGLRKNK